MARKTGVDLADKLSDDALGGFRKAHSDLTQANEILNETRAQREQDIKDAQEEMAAHDEKLARNAKVIGKLAELI